MSSVTQPSGKSVNARRRATMVPFFRGSIDARQADYSIYRLAGNSHRDRFSVSIPQPQLSGRQPSIHTQFGIVSRLTNFMLESTAPENHQAAIFRTCLA